MAKDKINILLVDDEEVLLDSIKRRLQIREFDVIAVNRGEKALEAARRYPIDVAILDLKMPGMSGKDVLVHLKRDYPWLEIVILTGHGSFDPEQETVYDQAYMFLAKPFELETLRQVLVEAYKKTVMNRKNISVEDMETILKSPDLKSPRDVLKKLKELDNQSMETKGGHLMESILVKDMMVPMADYATVSEDATLSEAVAALKEAQTHFDQGRYRHRAVLVMDKRGNVVGKVSQMDAIKALEPKYRGLADLKGLEGLYGFKEDSLRRMIAEHGLWKQPLDDICRKAATLRVRDIMYTPSRGEYVAEDATLNEAIHQLIIGQHQSLLVSRGKQIVGVLRLTDVFQRISDLMAVCSV